MKKLLLFLSIFAFPLSVFAEEILQDTVQLFSGNRQPESPAMIVTHEIKALFEKTMKTERPTYPPSPPAVVKLDIEYLKRPRMIYASSTYNKDIWFYHSDLIQRVPLGGDWNAGTRKCVNKALSQALYDKVVELHKTIYHGKKPAGTPAQSELK